MVGLSGCAAPAVDPDAVDDWLTQQSSVDLPGSLAMMSGMAGPVTEVVGEQGITVTFEEPERLTEVVFSCFGTETMSVDITTTSVEPTDAEISSGTRTDDLACDDSPHAIEWGKDAATGVTVDGLSDDGAAAWSAVVIGKD